MRSPPPLLMLLALVRCADDPAAGGADGTGSASGGAATDAAAPTSGAAATTTSGGTDAQTGGGTSSSSDVGASTGEPPAAPVWGYADLHLHMMAEEAFGGGWLYGRHAGPQDVALAACDGGFPGDHARLRADLTEQFMLCQDDQLPLGLESVVVDAGRVQ